MADLVLVWFHFDVTCGLFWSHFGSWWPLVVSFGHLSWPCFGLVLVSFVASFLDSFVASFLVSLVVSFLDSFVASFLVSLVASFLDSFWSHFWFLLWPHFGLILVSFLVPLVASFLFSFSVLFDSARAIFWLGSTVSGCGLLRCFLLFPVAVLAFFAGAGVDTFCSWPIFWLLFWNWSWDVLLHLLFPGAVLELVLAFLLFFWC